MANYIDKKELYAKFVEWKSSEAFKAGDKQPPETILLDAYTILVHNSKQRKWYNIAQEDLEDGIAQGMEFCIKYLHNFNVEKYKDPFTYITQLANNAILQLYNKSARERANRANHLVAHLASETYIRTDGEIDMVAGGEFSQNYIKHQENSMRDYND